MSALPGSQFARTESLLTEGFQRPKEHGTGVVEKSFSPTGTYDHVTRPAVRKSVKRRTADGFEVAARNMPGFPYRVKIGLKLKGRILLIDAADVFAVEAEGNYALLQRRSDSCLVRASISKLAEKLAPLGFVQIHRSVLVNAIWVEELCPSATGEYVLRLEQGRKYTVSRKYRNNLTRLAQVWVGASPFADSWYPFAMQRQA